MSKTQWFDIIYPQTCERTAKLLYQNVDKIYSEVTSQYGLEPSFRMPLVITPGEDNFNAFWSIVPYNHIVIYDTSIIDTEELNVFSQTLLSTFRHELTHAVTYNMKNDFWKGAEKVFGDYFLPGMLFVSTGMAEGATVSSESAVGEGRLNDEYAKHYVKQAKIEGKFPSYFDVMGSRDKSPYGASYYFNGAFHQWLQKEYGMSAYAKFWYNLVNLKNPGLKSAFKNAFGIKLKKAWQKFEEDYKVQELPKNPVESGLVKDFFAPGEQKYSNLNNQGSLYHSLTGSQKYIAWIDSYGNKIQYVERQDLLEEDFKIKTLFSQNGLQSIKFSPDGKYLVLSYYSSDKAGSSARVKIYDMKEKSTFILKERGLKNAALVKKDQDYYLLADKYDCAKNSLYIGKVEKNADGKIIRVNESKIIEEDYASLLFSFNDFDENLFVCIKKVEMQYFLSFYDLEGNLKLEYKMPYEKMVIRDLCVEGGNIYFSWTLPGTMPRLGKFYSETEKLELTTKDLSGGVFQPVFTQKGILYTGKFFEENRLLLVDENSFEKEEISLENTVEVKSQDKKVSYDFEEISIPSENYRALDYFTKGMLVPLSIYSTSYFGKNAGYTSNAKNYIPGLTWVTANPWSDGTNDLYILTGGWNYLNNSFGLEFIAKGGTDTSLFSSQFDVKTEFDNLGWKLSYGDFTFSVIYPFGKVSQIGFYNDFSCGIGRQDLKAQGLQPYHEFFFWDSSLFGIAQAENSSLYYTISDSLTLLYSNIHRAGPSRFEKSGFKTFVTFLARQDKSVEKSEIFVQGLAMSSGFETYIPRLLPVRNKNGLIYNMPSRLDFTFFPSSSNYAYTFNNADFGSLVFDLESESLFFGLEIQKALPFCSLFYLNDLYFSAGYSAVYGAASSSKKGFQTVYTFDYIQGLFSGEGILADSIYAKVTLELTPNLGILANSSFKLNLYLLTSFALHNTNDQKFAWTLGLSSSF